VPAIDDDGMQLYESRAIARYINDKENGKLVPRDLVGRARVEPWISVETSNVSPHAMKYVYNEFFKRPQSGEVTSNAEKQLNAALGVMDAQLGEHQFIAGDQFTLADVCFMPYFEYGMKQNMKDMGGELSQRRGVVEAHE
jgi:glutathione S-transferase